MKITSYFLSNEIEFHFKMELVNINKILNSIKKNLYQQPMYHFYYKKLNVKKNIVLVESTCGRAFQGYLLYLLEELEQGYLDFEIYLAVQDVKKIKNLLGTYHLSRVNIIKQMSRKYFKILASAEYLLNDITFHSFFIKKKGQKYINFWQEAPPKTFEQEVEHVTDTANVQRNLYMANKIIVSNHLFANTLISSLGLTGIYQGKIAVVPYQRDVALLDIDIAQVVCDYIFKDEPHELIKELSLFNGKETVVVLGGGFWDNGVTTALLNTFENIDLDKRNYVVLLGQKQLKKEYEFRVRELPDKIIFYSFPEQLNTSIFNRFLYLAYMRFEWFDCGWIRKRVGSVVSDDYNRIVGDLKIDHFIHFTGFGNRYSELIKYAPDEVNTVMYVHTDMIAEYKAKKNFSKKIIFSAYEQVDKIAVVHPNLKEGLASIAPIVNDKLYVMNNFLGEERIRKLAKADWLETLANVKMESGNKESLISNICDKNIVTFVNIGRFDYQKGHDRLIKSFEGVYKENQRIRLVIVAPHGSLRDQTLELVRGSFANTGIYVLGRMSNPYALLAKCGCFVLSSYYEGLGLVVYEALAVGISVVTVNLKETTAYLQNDEAIIVNNSISGIEEGMRKYLLGDYSNNEFDFSVPKERSRLEFEMLFKVD